MRMARIEGNTAMRETLSRVTLIHSFERQKFDIDAWTHDRGAAPAAVLKCLIGVGGELLRVRRGQVRDLRG